MKKTRPYKNKTSRNFYKVLDNFHKVLAFFKQKRGKKKGKATTVTLPYYPNTNIQLFSSKCKSRLQSLTLAILRTTIYRQWCKT